MLAYRDDMGTSAATETKIDPIRYLLAGRLVCTAFLKTQHDSNLALGSVSPASCVSLPWPK